MREVNPMDTDRAASWKLYIDAPMPMVTIFKTFDITNLIEIKSKGYKLNVLMCYCIAFAANKTKEFKLLPVGKKMIEYDKIGVNAIIANQNGGINSCDVPFLPDLKEFNDLYLKLTEKVYRTCNDYWVLLLSYRYLFNSIMFRWMVWKLVNFLKKYREQYSIWQINSCIAIL